MTEDVLQNEADIQTAPSSSRHLPMLPPLHYKHAEAFKQNSTWSRVTWLTHFAYFAFILYQSAVCYIQSKLCESESSRGQYWDPFYFQKICSHMGIL